MAVQVPQVSLPPAGRESSQLTSQRDPTEGSLRGLHPPPGTQCLSKSQTLPGTTTPTPDGRSALWHVSTASEAVTVVQIQLKSLSLQTTVPGGCTLGPVVWAWLL